MKCKPGYHHVKRHFRASGSGEKHKVEEHCRKNPKSKSKFLFKSNLDYLYERYRNKYKYKTLKKIKGYPQDKGQYDELIQFWLKYWKGEGLINDNIDPLLVKTMIAVESSFRERVVTDIEGSSATGLMQIVKKTMRILAQRLGKEVQKSNIDITQDEAKDANVNIATGVRWLIFKTTTSPWKNKKLKKDRVYGGVKYYYSWNDDGDDYAKKVFRLYDKSRN